MIVRITRHGDPIDTMSLAWDDCRSMADPPMATAVPAVTANPAARAASCGHCRPNWRRHSCPGSRPARSTTASASPRPTSAIVTLTANPSPTSTPAVLAGGTIPPRPPLLFSGGTRPPDPPGKDRPPPKPSRGPEGPAGACLGHHRHGRDAEHDRLAVHVRAGHERLEQQRVGRPQQGRAQLPHRVPARHPVQQQRGAGEGGQVGQAEHEHGEPHRGPAGQRGQRLDRGGERTVDRRGP